jgi:inorganic pyrophosphatase
MTDESGIDFKILAVPVPKLCPIYDNVKSYTDLPELLLKQIEHFFTHYKDLEKNKWTKVEIWEDKEVAMREILDSIKRYQQ